MNQSTQQDTSNEQVMANTDSRVCLSISAEPFNTLPWWCLPSIAKRVACKRWSFLPRLTLSLTVCTMALLGACVTPLVDRNLAREGGFWEQDENSDPHIVHRARANNVVIGELLTAGASVLVDGRPVQGPVAFPNGSRLSTGTNSGARLELVNGGADCQIDILDFRFGRSYGQSARCRHRVETVQSATDTRSVSTHYHIETTPQETMITVYQGAATAASRTQPGQSVLINAGEEAVVFAGGVVGPRPVPPNQLEQRRRWRDQFRFVRSGVDWGAVAGAAAVVGGAVLLKQVLDDDKEGDDPNVVAVPDLLGRTLAEARALLQRSRLTLGRVSGRGRVVVRQDPKPGARVAVGSAVAIWMRGAQDY